MNKIVITILLLVTCAFFSCKDERTYAEQLKEEQKLIADYIKRNNIKVVKTMPEVWTENLFYLSPSGLYFHLSYPGDTLGDPVEANNLIIPRYLKYTLNAKPDTVHRWSTIDSTYPQMFFYQDVSTEGKAMHEAVKYMKYHESRAKMIVFSKLGPSEDEESVIPYAYDLHIKIQK